MNSLPYEPVRVAFVGVGNWSKVLATALNKSQKLICASCYARTPQARRAFAQDWGCREAASYDEILTDPAIEGVIIAARDSAHADLTVAAAEAGKHVFCEKPIACSVIEGFRMMNACQKAAVVLSIAHLQRRMGAMRRMKEMISAGGLGKVIQAEASFGTSAGLSLTPDNWRFYQDEFPGGCMMGLGVHHADNLQYFLGPVQRVSALCNRLAVPAEVTDVGGAIIQFESGAVGYLGSNFAAAPHWRLSLMGTEGNLHLHLRMTRRNREEYLSFLERSDESAELIFHPTAGEPIPVSFHKKNNVLVELEEFADCVRLGRIPEVGAKEGLHALAVVLAIIRSASEGRIVEVKEILEFDREAAV